MGVMKTSVLMDVDVDRGVMKRAVKWPSTVDQVEKSRMVVIS